MKFKALGIEVLNIEDLDVAYRVGFKVDQCSPCMKLHLKVFIIDINIIGIVVLTLRHGLIHYFVLIQWVDSYVVIGIHV